jgi:hypothetical protein
MIVCRLDATESRLTTPIPEKKGRKVTIIVKENGPAAIPAATVLAATVSEFVKEGMVCSNAEIQAGANAEILADEDQKKCADAISSGNYWPASCEAYFKENPSGKIMAELRSPPFNPNKKLSETISQDHACWVAFRGESRESNKEFLRSAMPYHSIYLVGSQPHAKLTVGKELVHFHGKLDILVF